MRPTDKNFLCLLGTSYKVHVYEYLKDLQAAIPDYKVLYFLDELPESTIYSDGSIEIVSISKSLCAVNGYKGSVSGCSDRPCSRDMFFYFFIYSGAVFNNVWCIEEDVFIPSKDTILSVDINYPGTDLLLPPKAYSTSDIVYNEKFLTSMGIPESEYECRSVAVMRLNFKIFSIIEQLARTCLSLFPAEIMLPTITNTRDIGCVYPEQFEYVLRSSEESKIAENDFHPYSELNFYHPMKSYTQHQAIREYNNWHISKSQELNSTEYEDEFDDL